MNVAFTETECKNAKGAPAGFLRYLRFINLRYLNFQFSFFIKFSLTSSLKFLKTIILKMV